MNTPNLQIVIDQIGELAERSRYKEALNLALRNIKHYPVDIYLHTACAYCYTELRKFRKAKKFLKSAQVIQADFKWLIFVRANWYMRKKKFKESEKILLDYFNKFHTLEGARKLCILYETMHGVYRSKIFKMPGTKAGIEKKFLSTVDKIGASSCQLEAFKMKAMFYIKNGKFKQAHRYLSEAIAYEPNDPWAYFHKAYAYLRKSKNGSASRFLKDGLMLKPDDDLGLKMLAHIKVHGSNDNFIYHYALRIAAIVVLIILSIAIHTPIIIWICVILIRYSYRRKFDKALRELKTFRLSEY